MKKILTIVGARPQFIKAAVVSRALKKNIETKEVLVHTGQHYDNNMSDIFFEELDIPRPDYQLGVGGGTHGQNTGRMLEKLESLMQLEKPDWVMVFGDTDSTLAGSLSASKLHIPVAHVEAGLRSFNRYMPEEINRVITDHISSVLFAPTETAAEHLTKEGITGERVQIVGDVMYDAALYYKNRASKPTVIDNLKIKDHTFVLCTVHRAENTDNLNRMKEILAGLHGINSIIVLPIHPRTKSRINQMGLKVPDNVKIIDPVSYLEMVWLEMNCSLVITDSGGVQKEAYFHKKRCLTLRDETEWTELVDIGANEIVGVSPERLINGFNKIKNNYYMTEEKIYGSGNSGELISNYFNK